MCDFVNKYLGDSGNRDKVMAIVQFLPQALAGPAEGAGNMALAKSLASLGKMADSYRAVTRLTLLFGALSKETLTKLQKSSGDDVTDTLDRLAHMFHVFFCAFENTAVYASHGVLRSSLGRMGGCAVTCWFYVLLLNIIRQLYVLAKKNPSEEQKKQGMVNLLKLGCFFIFSMTCIAPSGPQLLENPSGALVPIHKTLQLIAPKHLALSDSVRGLLGFVASMCDFY